MAPPSRRRRRRRSSSSIQFVVCPAGCGKRMLETEVNAHLDRCCLSSASLPEESNSHPDDVSDDNNSNNNHPNDSREQKGDNHQNAATASISSSVPKNSILLLMNKKKSIPKQRKGDDDLFLGRGRKCPCCEKMFHRAFIHHHLEKCILKSSTTNAGKTHSKQLQQSQEMDGEAAAATREHPRMDAVSSSSGAISQIGEHSLQDNTEQHHPIESIPAIDTMNDNTEIHLQQSSSSSSSTKRHMLDQNNTLQQKDDIASAAHLEEDLETDCNECGNIDPNQETVHITASCSDPQCSLLAEQHGHNRSFDQENINGIHRLQHITPMRNSFQANTIVAQETNVEQKADSMEMSQNAKEPEFVAACTDNSLDKSRKDIPSHMHRSEKKAKLDNHPMKSQCSREEDGGSGGGGGGDGIENRSSNIPPQLPENRVLEPFGVNNDDDDGPPNLFAHMMESSKRVFARPSSDAVKAIPQVFHLHEDGTVSLHLQNTFEFDLMRTWSNVVTLKDRRLCDSSSATAFDVTLSSAIPNYESRTVQWVRQHSRLSVSVLKSILQKAIRRRKPLPAVRCAMELADKSLGELLRRLPVIILEDSFVHPDLPLLMWIMMAYPRDFIPHPRLIARIFHIVFEVASCQWLDPLPDNDLSETTSTVTTLSLLYEADHVKAPQLTSWRKSEALLWSMLVRAEYGGMKGDVEMLRCYADLWYRRFTSDSAPDMVLTRVFGASIVPEPSASWQETLKKLYQRAKEQGSSRVDALASDGIDRLIIDDVCIEGVDFHCSPIVDKLLAEEELCGLCHDFLILFGNDGSISSSSPTEMHSRLASVFKKCMWTHSSAINRRRPLIAVDAASSPGIDKYTRLWNEILSSRVASYQRSYIEQRLVQA
jgi:hypothetical protein